MALFITLGGGGEEAWRFWVEDQMIFSGKGGGFSR